MIFARIGAVLYFVWGLLHIVAAYKVYALGQTLEQGMVQGRVFQDAWNLLFFALFGMVVSVAYNWNNSKVGYWMNLVVVSAGDIGFIVTILLPGYLPLFPGAMGPLLWLLAVFFSTVAIMREKSQQT
ncbi:hypothetical protein [Aliikangiella coralliicola]|uniref:DUF423 domain-containing protein n=1 Tax=Aliikangiella coralliicola TaxID=2592383 RepID=A0A545UJ01_9GAMM|nr:hypothetical protein [Aliikangiella coralliicola]TQV89454.1 hypothetical protein FLL46_00815 [Aliikangiella coralliicola]